MVVGLTMRPPRGTIRLGHAPMSAPVRISANSSWAPKDPRIITSVVLRIRPRPTERTFEG